MVDLLGQLPVEEATASQIVARREGVAALQVAIAGLPSDQRQAIQLHLLKGMTLEETATRWIARQPPYAASFIGPKKTLQKPWEEPLSGSAEDSRMTAPLATEETKQ